MNEGRDVYGFFGEGADGFLEGAAPAADDLDFVDHERREVERFAGGGGALKDNGASWADHLHGELEAGGGAGAIDDDVLIVSWRNVSQGPGADRPFLTKGELVGMLADDSDGAADVAENLGDEEAEAAVAEDGDPFLPVELDLLLNLAGGGERFDENGLIVIDGFGDGMKIGGGKAEQLGEGAAVIENADDRAVAAVGGEAGLAEIAAAADDVDLAGDALADEILIGGVENVGDEFMTEDAAEIHVAFADFEIGGADAGAADAQEGVAFGIRRVGVARAEVEGLIEDESAHAKTQSERILAEQRVAAVIYGNVWSAPTIAPAADPAIDSAERSAAGRIWPAPGVVLRHARPGDPVPELWQHSISSGEFHLVGRVAGAADVSSRQVPRMRLRVQQQNRPAEHNRDHHLHGRLRDRCDRRHATAAPAAVDRER